MAAALQSLARMRAFALVMLSAAPAAADALDETRGGALHDRVDPVVVYEAADLHTSWRIDATLASRAVTSSGEADVETTASVGAELAVSNDECDLLALGGHLDATVGGSVPVSAQQSTSVCPLSGTMLLRFDNLVQWDVRPSLLARPRMRPDASRGNTFAVTMGAEGPVFNDPGPLTLLPTPPPEYLTFVQTTMTVALGWTAGDFAGGDATVGAVSAFVTYHREREDDVPLEVDVMAVEMLGTTPASDGDRDPGNDGMAMLARIDAVRWRGAHWRGLRIGGAIGVGFVSAGVGALEPHHDTLVVVAEPALTVERDLDDELTVRAGAERTHWARYDGHAVIDDRATLGLTRRAGRLRLRAEGFVAKSYLIAADDRITRVLTGGLTCVAETDLGDHAVMRVRTDLGRGFYASGATLDRPRLAGEVLATIDLYAGNR